MQRKNNFLFAFSSLFIFAVSSKSIFLIFLSKLSDKLFIFKSTFSIWLIIFALIEFIFALIFLSIFSIFSFVSLNSVFTKLFNPSILPLIFFVSLSIFFISLLIFSISVSTKLFIFSVYSQKYFLFSFISEFNFASLPFNVSFIVSILLLVSEYNSL